MSRNTSDKIFELAEIAEISAGQSAPKDNQFGEVGLPFIRAGHLESLISGASLTELPKVSKEIAQAKRLKVLPINTIVFAKSGMSATKDRVYKLTNEAYFVSHLAAVVPNEKCDISFLKYFLSNYRTSRLILDPAYPSIKLSDIQKIQIPLPPLSEQKHIAKVLDTADALIKKNKTLLQEYNALQQAIFLDMFGDPVRNPKGWEYINFGAVLKGIVGGFSVGGEQRQLKDDELGVLKVSAVTSGIFNPEEYKAIPKRLITKNPVLPRKGDLIFSRANTRELVGAVAIVRKDYNWLFLPDKLWRLELDKDNSNVQFVHSLLTYHGFKPEMTKIATGTSGSMLNISKEKLRKLRIPIPPIDLQNKFASIIENIEQQKEKAKESLAYSEELFGALVQRYFGGINR